MGTDAGTGLPKWMEAFARNLADIIEAIWKLLVSFFQKFLAFVMVRRVVCSLKSGAFEEMELPYYYLHEKSGQ